MGWTGSNREDVGGFIIPSRVHCFDGITNIIKPNIKFVYPEKQMFDKVKNYFEQHEISHSEGTTICTPSADMRVFRHFEPVIKKLKPISIELELSPFFFAAQEKGASVAAILIVSDNNKKSISTKKGEETRSKTQADAIRYAAEILTHS